MPVPVVSGIRSMRDEAWLTDLSTVHLKIGSTFGTDVKPAAWRFKRMERNGERIEVEKKAKRT